MARISGMSKVDDKRTLQILEDACEKVETAENELLVDLSAVLRLDPHAISTLNNLSARANDKNVKVVLRGLSVDIYKVLKLVNLANRFSFIA